MKTTRYNLLAATSVFFGAVTYSQAADFTKANNTDTMNATSSWVGGVVPNSTGNLVFDNTVDATTAANTLAFSNGQFLGGITILDPGGNITTRTTSNGTTTWANNALIDMSAASADFNWSNGTMRIDNGNYSPTFTVATGRTLTIGGGGVVNRGNTKTLTMAGTGDILITANSGSGGAMNFNVNGATVTMTNATSGWTYGTVSSGKLVIGNSTVLDGKRLTMNSANGLGFGTGITTASLGGLEGSGTFALTNADTNAVALTIGSNNTSYSLSGNVGGAGSLTKVGSGTQTLSGDNSFAGGISLNEGTITFGHSNAAAGGPITALDGTSLNLANSSSVFLGGTVAASGTSANVTLTSDNISAGFSTAFTGSSDQIFTISGGNQVNIASSSQQFSGFSGTVAVDSGATLRFSSSGLNNGGDNTTFDLTGNVVTRNNGFLALGALSGSGNISMGGSGPTNGQLYLTIGAKGIDTTYSGAISDSDEINGKIVNVTKTGSGTQTFAGTSTYTGATNITAGTLLVNGSLGNTAVNVTGGTLGGNGTIAGAVTVGSGAFLAAGASIGTLEVASATLDGTLSVEYDGAGLGTIDLLNVTGAFDITNGIVDFSMFGSAADDDSYIFATYGSLVGSSFANSLNLPAGYEIDYAFGGNNIALVAVPEPAAALMSGLGLLALLRRRRS